MSHQGADERYQMPAQNQQVRVLSVKELAKVLLRQHCRRIDTQKRRTSGYRSAWAICSKMLGLVSFLSSGDETSGTATLYDASSKSCLSTCQNLHVQ